MPEGPEVRIMSDFINQKTKDQVFDRIYHVKKGNIPYLDDSISEPFVINSRYYGKKIIIELVFETTKIPIYVFMGMSGSWKWTETNKWSDTKFTRLRFDNQNGLSLLLYGGYLGPKYSMYENFKSSKIGPDIIQEFDKFVENINISLNHNDFNKPIFELLLDQRYFSGVGNYLRSTILYYSDDNPFFTAKQVIDSNPNFLKICRDVIEKSYQYNGGQLKDWSNPFETSSEEFDQWVYYQKGSSIKDRNGRTFWYNPKWLA